MKQAHIHSLSCSLVLLKVPFSFSYFYQEPGEKHLSHRFRGVGWSRPDTIPLGLGVGAIEEGDRERVEVWGSTRHRKPRWRSCRPLSQQLTLVTVGLCHPAARPKNNSPPRWPDVDFHSPFSLNGQLGWTVSKKCSMIALIMWWNIPIVIPIVLL